MKKMYLLSIMLLVSVIVSAQEKMKITLVGGGVVEYNVADIVKVGFEAESRLDVSPAELNFSNKRETKSIVISSNTNWTVSSNVSWLSVNKSSGDGEASITITAEANTSTLARNGTLTIKAGDITKTVSAVQNASPAPYITISVGTYNVPSSASVVSVSLSSNTSWTVSSNQSWATPTKTSGSGDGTISVNVAANTSTSSRTAVITVTGGGKTATCSIVQEAAAPAPYITMLVGSYSVSSTASTVSVSFSSNTSWTVSSNQSWAAPAVTSGSGNGNVSVNVSANTSTSSRTAVITVTGGGKTATCSIVQAGATSSLLYAEPYLNWGSNKTAVKNFMSGYTLYEETDNYLLYLGKHKEVLTQYVFNSSKLAMSIVALHSSQVTMSEVDAFLSKTYVYLGESNGERLYISQDSKTVVLVSEDADISAIEVRYIDESVILGSQMFEEPFIPWGTTRANVKTMMSQAGYSVYRDDDTSESGYSLIYYGEYQEVMSMYFFNSSRQLNLIAFVFDSDDVSMTEIQDYIVNELGYALLQQSSDTYYYLTADNSSIIRLYSSNLSGGTVIYLEYQPSGVSLSKSRGEINSINDEILPVTLNTPYSDFAEFKNMKMQHLFSKIPAVELKSFDFLK